MRLRSRSGNAPTLFSDKAIENLTARFVGRLCDLNECVTCRGEDAVIDLCTPFSSEGIAGCPRLRFSIEEIEEEEDVVVDYVADGSVVGVELVSICPETVAALGKVARRYDLDLGALFARPIVLPHAA